MANPMYRQIAEDLREQIESGELAPGSQLPTELELRDRHSASRNTVRDAIKWLINLGLVETRPGQGTFVVRKIDPYVNTLTADPSKGSAEDRVLVLGPGEGETYREEVEKSLREPYKTKPQVEILEAFDEVAGRLGVEDGVTVVSRRQKRYIDGTPWSLETSYYPMAFVIQGADRLIQAGDIEEGTVRYLADVLGRRQVGYRDWISVRAPDATEATFFNLPQDGRVGVYEIFRTAFDQTGTPTRLTVSLYPTDRNQFVVNVGEVPTDLAVRVSESPNALAGPLTPAQPAHVTS
jgi:GntR family transcriptional regulator